MQTFLLIAAGLILLTIGAELLIRGSSKLALHLKVPPLVVGLTVVAFGTSTPELVVSMSSNLLGLGDIAVGNVVGSNLFNIAVILGLAAVIRPIKVNLKILKIDMPIVVGLTMLIPLLLHNNEISRWEGAMLSCGIVGYAVFTVRFGKREAERSQSATADNGAKGSLVFQIMFILGGLGALAVGSRLLVNGSVELAERFRISEAIVGLTVVAAGTSLPELATSVMATVRKQEDIAIGNILGSNIFNILAILGLTGWTAPIRVQNISMVDVGAMVLVTLFLLPLIRTGFRITRIEGAALLMLYGGYLYYLWP